MATQNDFFGQTGTNIPSFLGQQDWKDVLEQEPRTAFFAQQPRFGDTSSQKRFFEGQFQNIYNEFLGNLGKQIQQGQQPTARFSSFAESFPFTERFGSTPPSLRPGGMNLRRLRPPSRFLYF